MPGAGGGGGASYERALFYQTGDRAAASWRHIVAEEIQFGGQGRRPGIC